MWRHPWQSASVRTTLTHLLSWMPQSCAPKFVAVWPCSRCFFLLTRAAQRWRTWLLFPRMARSTLSVSCGVGPSAIASWWSRASCFVSQIFFYHHIHKQCNHSTFFFFLLSVFLHLFLVDSHDCFTSIMFCLSKKKNSNHRIHKHCSLSIPLFFLTSFVFADSDGWFTSIMCSFKKLFSSHSRALLLSFTFFVSATPSVFW